LAEAQELGKFNAGDADDQIKCRPTTPAKTPPARSTTAARMAKRTRAPDDLKRHPLMD
jgi:hypothetical protein